MPVLKEVIQVKLCFYEILTKILTKQEKSNFLKEQKTRFREKIDFRRLCVSLRKVFSSQIDKKRKKL